MKKEKKPHKQSKPKDFSHSPFKNLKSFQASEPTRQVEKPKPAPPPPAVEDEGDLFLREMGGVVPIGGTGAKKGKKQEQVKPLPRSIAVDEEGKRLFMKAVEEVDVKFHEELPDDVVPLNPSRSVNRMRELKKGAIRIDLELDLHGLTRDEALSSLESFILGAYKRQQKAVLVITGRGNRSPGEPVLQGAVIGWLREKGKTMVAEFSPAPRQMGGDGALVVFLREKREPTAA